MRKVAICLSLAAIVFAGYTMIGVAAQGMKPAIHGLLNRNGSSIPSGYRASLAGYDVSGDATGSVGWSQLQSAPNGPITSNNPIDAAIADVDAWNAANPSAQEALKLRVTAGAQTPAWALNLGGTCVELTNPQTPSQQEMHTSFLDRLIPARVVLLRRRAGGEVRPGARDRRGHDDAQHDLLG